MTPGVTCDVGPEIVLRGIGHGGIFFFTAGERDYALIVP